MKERGTERKKNIQNREWMNKIMVKRKKKKLLDVKRYWGFFSKEILEYKTFKSPSNFPNNFITVLWSCEIKSHTCVCNCVWVYLIYRSFRISLALRLCFSSATSKNKKSVKQSRKATCLKPRHVNLSDVTSVATLHDTFVTYQNKDSFTRN